MVRTHGAHRYKPRVQFSTPKKDGAGTSRAATARSSDQVTETPPPLAPASVLEEAQASEPHPGDTRPGWDLGPLLLCIRDHTGGPCLPSGPEHLARVSHRDLGPSRHLLQLIRVRRPNYPHIRGSRVRCLAAIRFQGTSIFVLGTSMESLTMTYRH